MYRKCLVPKDYRPVLDVQETERAIKQIKDFFEAALAEALNLRRVTAPLFVKAGMGINDDLSGLERPISFPIKNMNNTRAEVVQSLAKWKRIKLASLKVGHGRGIYTDMNAIRPDEDLDNLHSLYVDQWDWERVISRQERCLSFLQDIVRQIYLVLKKTELFLHSLYPEISPTLPPEIIFLHALELEEKYPRLSPGQREDVVCEKHGAVFVIGIGAPLKAGPPHDLRAPDYDDWTTPTDKGPGLNGDILVWYPGLQTALEMSSMGIRVDEQALRRQLKLTGTSERENLFFHQKLLRGGTPPVFGRRHRTISALHVFIEKGPYRRGPGECLA